MLLLFPFVCLLVLSHIPFHNTLKVAKIIHYAPPLFEKPEFMNESKVLLAHESEAWSEAGKQPNIDYFKLEASQAKSILMLSNGSKAICNSIISFLLTPDLKEQKFIPYTNQGHFNGQKNGLPLQSMLILSQTSKQKLVEREEGVLKACIINLATISLFVLNKNFRNI